MRRLLLVLLAASVTACARPSAVAPPAPAPESTPPAATAVQAPEVPPDCCTCQLWGVFGPAAPLDRDALPLPEACAAVLEAEPCASRVCAPPM